MPVPAAAEAAGTDGRGGDRGRCPATSPRSPGGSGSWRSWWTRRPAADAGGVVGIHAIGGMAGVGKTAFAVHAAHRLADRFPGGQIFLPLHGHTPGQQPVDPADALASLLLTAGVPAGQIPPGLEARMALWRDRLAERQLLLVLDDAASSEQVRPLLPGAGGSLVLVTSRRHLSALEDATAVSLDTLPPDEAAALLVRLAGRAGLSPDDPAVAEITRLCGFLPLAIGMVARQLHHHPAWTAAGRAAELAAARGPAGADGDGEPVGGRRVQPVLRRPHRGPAAAVPAAGAAPRRRHRRLRRRRPGRHRPRRRPPRPGGPVRPVPADRAGPGPVPDARPDPRARPRPGRPP